MIPSANIYCDAVYLSRHIHLNNHGYVSLQFVQLGVQHHFNGIHMQVTLILKRIYER